MEDKSTSVQYMKAQLAAEFKQISDDYNELRESHDREVAQMLQRRREIVLSLVDVRLTHREIGALLGISAGRVGQLVKGAPGYAPQRFPRDT